MTAKETITKHFKTKSLWQVGNFPIFQASLIIKEEKNTGTKYDVYLMIAADHMVMFGINGLGNTIEEAEENAYENLLHNIVFHSLEEGYLKTCENVNKNTAHTIKTYYSQPGRKKKR